MYFVAGLPSGGGGGGVVVVVMMVVAMVVTMVAVTCQHATAILYCCVTNRGGY